MSDQTDTDTDDLADDGSKPTKTKFSGSNYPEPGKLEVVYTKGNGSVVFDTSTLPPAILGQLAAFGLNSYLTSQRDKPADHAECRVQDEETFASLREGVFEIGRLANGGVAVSQLSRALAVFAGKADRWEEFRDQVILPIYKKTLTNKDSTDAEREAGKSARAYLDGLRNKAEIKPILMRIEMEDAAKRKPKVDVNLDDILGQVS